MSEKDLKNLKQSIFQLKEIKKLFSEIEIMERMWEEDLKKLMNKKKDKNSSEKTEYDEEKT